MKSVIPFICFFHFIHFALGQPPLTPAQRIAANSSYVKSTIKDDGYNKCLTCVAPLRNDFFCPSTGYCFSNQTVPNPYNFDLPCPSAILMNQTD